MNLDIAPLARASDIFAGVAYVVRPLARITVAEAAERHRYLENKGGGYQGPWTFARAPYLKRPTEKLTDERFRLVAIMGPSQCGKSEVANNWLLHSALYSPANMVWLQADRAIMGDYVREKIDPMIELCGDLRRRRMQAIGSDNVYRKAFVGGMIVYFVWPVPTQMRMRTAPRYIIDDYDDVPQDIGGQGDPITLLAARGTTFEGREKGLVLSSPSLGPSRGIEALVASGTDERYNVRCTSCEERITLSYDLLHFDRRGTPADAERTAVVKCPQNGCVIEPRQKANLIRSGVWIGPEQTVTAKGRIEGPERETDIYSARINGLMGFQGWPRLARAQRAAEIAFEIHQDEAKLRSHMNTGAGINYRSQIAGALPVEPEGLEARRDASDYELGTAPGWVRCLTAAVDVQGNRFEILVVGWGAEWRSARVDRFALFALDDGETAIDPAGRAEHWGVLLKRVIWSRYPVAGDPESSLPIMATAIDTGGIEGVTDNAFAFWGTAINAGVPPTAVTLVKGGNNPNARLLPAPTVDAKRATKKGMPDPGLYVANVNRIKDTIDVRLRREEPGPGYMAFPRGYERRYLDETTAEEKIDGIWTQLPGRRNETLDLEVYNYVNMIRLGGNDSTLNWVPAWAQPQRSANVKTPARLARRRRGLRTSTRDMR